MSKEHAEWQPIQTAPLDGTPVLLWGPKLLHTGQCVVARYLKGDIEWWHVDDGDGKYPLRGPAPTHWMDEPARPKNL